MSTNSTKPAPSVVGQSLQFVPISSEVELPFYSALFSYKLEHDKLDDSVRQVVGLYEPDRVEPERSCKLQVLGNALTSDQYAQPSLAKLASNVTSGPIGSSRAEGTIKNTNTIEELRKINHTEVIQHAGRTIWDAINDGSIYSVPSLLSSFKIISFADLKKYTCTYWFAFPAINSSWVYTAEIGRFTPEESTHFVDRVGSWRYSVDSRQRGFFLAKKVPWSPGAQTEDNNMSYDFKIGSLGDFEKGFFDNVDDADRFIAFVDTSTYAQAPAWQLRNLLILVRQRYGMKKANIICFRDVRQRRHEARSIILFIAEVEDKKTPEGQMPKVTGWERNRGVLKAKQANLAEYMDPKKIADNSVDLNLKLMKWRIAPDLNLDIIKKTKCLLLGAGTLGSYVSRNLMGWGVRKITLVDYGKVSFSNPVRQPLFQFADCLEGGAPKATRAAEALKQIYPGVESEGHVLSVPMLGHPYTDDGKQTKADFEKLHQLIDEHDVVFLLMDTRESRWLPTVMGKASGKIVINSALGFDSWVVMRHGAEPQEEGDAALGCYFCNDVVSPANSIKDQTLDQQCTVTRPGVAAIASALAVELLTSLLQHPLGVHADAPKGPSAERDPPEHPLGLVPHQIRGYVSTFQNLVIRGQSYENCSACSPAILEEYRNEGWNFVKKALLEKDYVSELSGLAAIQRRTDAMNLAMDWDEEVGEGQEEGDGELL